MPSCDQIGVPIHFHSSTTSGSASLMSLRILLRVSPRQSPSSAILFEMSSDADWPWLAPDFFMFSSWKFQIYFICKTVEDSHVSLSLPPQFQYGDGVRRKLARETASQPAHAGGDGDDFGGLRDGIGIVRAGGCALAPPRRAGGCHSRVGMPCAVTGKTTSP